MHEQPPPYQPAPPYGAPQPPQQPYPGQPQPRPQQPYGQPQPQQIELRPSAAQYRSQLAKRSLVFGLLVVVFMLRIDSLVELVIMLVAIGVTILAAIGAIVRYFKVVRVQMVPGWTRYTRWSGKPVVVEVAGSRGLLGRQPIVGQTLLTVVGADGRRAFRLSGDMWSPQDVQTVARLSGYPTDPNVQRAKDWESRLPGSTTWLDRHPFLFAFLLAGAVLVLITVVVVTVML